MARNSRRGMAERSAKMNSWHWPMQLETSHLGDDPSSAGVPWANQNQVAFSGMPYTRTRRDELKDITCKRYATSGNAIRCDV